MRRFGTHLWKEWREHRAVLVGIAVAIPALTTAAFAGFASFGAQLANGAFLFTGAAAAMAALALGVELFAGEVTRKTIGFWRRQPDGLATGVAAKLTLLVLAVVLATALGGGAFWAACRTFVGAEAADAAWSSLGERDTYAISFLALVFASWVLLASTWVARGAAAVGTALLLLAAIGSPGALLWGERTAFLRSLIAGAGPAIVAWILFPFALSGLSIALGRRRADRPLRAALASLAVILVVGGAAYAHASARLARWDDVAPGDPDARVTSLFVGSGGRIAYATVARVGDDLAARTHAIDLSSGATTPIGAPDALVYPWFEGVRHGETAVRSGVSLLETSRRGVTDASRTPFELFDGATAKSLGVFTRAPSDERAAATVRPYVRESESVRTRDGRRAWVMRRFVPKTTESSDGSPEWAVETRIERETPDGTLETVVFPASERAGITRALEFGWTGWLGDSSVFVPADARSVGDCLPLRWEDRPGFESHGSGHDRLDDQRYVYRRGPRVHDETWSLRVVDVVASSDAVLPGSDPDDRLVRVRDGKIWVWRPPASGALRAGELRTIDASTGVRGPAAAVDAGIPFDLPVLSLAGVTPRGAWILSFAPGGCVRYDPVAHRLSDWTPIDRPNAFRVEAIPDEEHVLVTRYETTPAGAWSQTLHRQRLGSGESVRVFPR